MEMIHAIAAGGHKTRQTLSALQRLTNTIETIAKCAERLISAVGGLGNGAQGRFVQAAVHGLVLGVEQPLTAAGRSRDEHLATARSANADREDHNIFRRQRLCLVHAALLQIFAIGNQHENLPPPIFFDRRKTFIQGAANVRSRHGNRSFIHGLQGIAKRVVIQRERALQKRLAGKRHEADAATSEILHEFLNRQLRPREAAWIHVRGQHALRAVEQEQHVFAERF